MIFNFYFTQINIKIYKNNIIKNIIIYKIQLMEQNHMTTNTLSNISFQDVKDKIIKTFPIYHNIFKQYLEKGKNVSWELNRLYQPIFAGLMEYYEKFMDEQTILDIMTDITIKYNPDKSFTIIDYLEYLYGGIYYETFLHEIKKINPNIIRYEHLCVFEYIIKVESTKYSQYVNTINIIKMVEPDTKLLSAMEYRLSNCIKKISFCISWVKRNYPSNEDFIELCMKIVEEKGLTHLLDLESVNTLDTFMNWNSK